MRISDWSSDVCSSDLPDRRIVDIGFAQAQLAMLRRDHRDLVRPAVRLGADWPLDMRLARDPFFQRLDSRRAVALVADPVDMGDARLPLDEGDQRMFVPVMRDARSEEHTSELPSLMRTSYAVFRLK